MGPDLAAGGLVRCRGHLKGQSSKTGSDPVILQSPNKPTVMNQLRNRVAPTASRRWYELIRNLAVRDVEIRYKHSLLGLYWALINPLVMAAIYSFVFGTIFHVSSGPLPYVVFLLTGFTFWNFLNNGLMSATASVTGNAQLLAKLYFPRVVLPAAAVIARLIDFAFSFVILLIFCLIYGVSIRWTVVFLPVVLLVQMVFVLGLGFLLAALNVLLRDISQLIGLVLLMWMYLTPVMYRASKIPVNLRTLFFLNPMSSFLELERDLMFSGKVSDPMLIAIAVGWTVVSYVVGLTVFRRVEPLFAEVM